MLEDKEVINPREEAMPEVSMSFEAAVTEASRNGKTHLLLGNGFSRAIFDNTFSYSSLLDQANFENCSPNVRPLFDKLGTTDFEAVVKSLEDSAKVLELYLPNQSSVVQTLRTDASKLRETLAETLAGNHPENPSEISESQYTSCRTFLRRFDRILTLNYDLLLYWVLMKELNDESMRDSQKIISDDGFRHGEEGDDYVVWDGDHNQNIYYLHGALHLFQGESELKKYTWSRTGVSLLEQINASLSDNLFPLFVSHGTSKQKKGQILRNGYLTKCFRGIYGMAGSLFTLGASLPDRDFHVLKAVSKSKITTLYVGLWGDEDSGSNRDTKRNVEQCQSLRNSGKYPLSIKYYNAATARPWG